VDFARRKDLKAKPRSLRGINKGHLLTQGFFCVGLIRNYPSVILFMLSLDRGDHCFSTLRPYSTIIFPSNKRACPFCSLASLSRSASQQDGRNGLVPLLKDDVISSR
jgi:hypothetical protein